MDECGHYSCKYCFGAFIESALNDGADCVIKTCPTYKCPMIIQPELFTEYLPSDKLKERYSKFLVQNFVESNKALKYCPSPGC